LVKIGADTLSPEDLRQFLYREARFLDDKEWDNWLDRCMFLPTGSGRYPALVFCMAVTVCSIEPPA
jgi:hypothetical protein